MNTDRFYCGFPLGGNFKSGPLQDLSVIKVFSNAIFSLAYRTTQECLTNIAKHARVGKAHIEAKAIRYSWTWSYMTTGKRCLAGSLLTATGFSE